MVKAVIRKLTKFDIMGALSVKYFGLSVGLLLVLYVIAYKQNFMGVRDRVRLPFLDKLLDRVGGVK